MAFLKLFFASSFLAGLSCLQQEEGERASRAPWLGSRKREDKPHQVVHWSHRHGPKVFSVLVKSINSCLVVLDQEPQYTGSDVVGTHQAQHPDLPETKLCGGKRWLVVNADS
jgi:hypothetical protein